MDNGILSGLVTLTIFSQMLTIGVMRSPGQLASVWQRPEVLLRSLIAVLVLVPMVVVILLWVFDLPPAVATGLAILAAAPGAPLTTKRAQMAAADLNYVSSLQLALAMLAVVVTPVTLTIFYALFELQTERVGMRSVVQQVATVTFLPIVIGLLLQRTAPKLVARISRPVQLIANGLFALMALAVIGLFVFVPDARAMLAVGWSAYTAIAIMAIAALAIGHGLARPAQSQRSALAVASVARNIGLALFVLGLSEAGRSSVPTVIVYLVLGVIIASLYSVWSKRQSSVEGEGT